MLPDMICFSYSYFIMPKRLEGSLATEEDNMYGENAKYIFACNGWVMGDNPLKNFAEPGAYLLYNIYLQSSTICF